MLFNYCRILLCFGTAVGCVLKYQLCNPDLPKGQQQCSPLGGYLDTLIGAGDLWPEPEKWEKLSSLVMNILEFDITSIPTSLGTGSLTARYGFSGGIQGPLPNNQWQLEIEHWFKAQLAWLQNLMVEFATGPSDPSMRKFNRPQQDADGSRYFCQNQVRKPHSPSPDTKEWLSMHLRPPENPHHGLHQLQHFRPLLDARARHAHHHRLIHS